MKLVVLGERFAMSLSVCGPASIGVDTAEARPWKTQTSDESFHAASCLVGEVAKLRRSDVPKAEKRIAQEKLERIQRRIEEGG